MLRRWPMGVWALLLLVLSGMAGWWLLHRLYPLKYEAALLSGAREFELDPNLVAAVIRTESRFRPTARSPQGARGLMQIMPETARWISGQMKIPYDPAMLDDPAYNIRMGCWYLRNLHREFGGDRVLALAAYNAGRNNVQAWLKENRWTGEQATLEQIPFPETRLYVAQVLRSYQIYRWLYR